MPRPLLMFACFALALPAGVQAAEPTRDSLVERYSKDVRPLLKTHCFKCHAEDDKRDGGTDFASVKEADSPNPRTLWKRAAKRIASGEMPPEGEKPIPAADRAKLAAWLADVQQFVETDPARRDPGPAPLRRLTRTEYGNTLRDLFGMKFDPGELGIPEDSTTDGFANLAVGLTLSPSQTESYFAAADKILDAIYGKPAAKTALLNPKPGKELPDRAAAETILTRLLARAYRRPAQAEDSSRLLKIFDTAFKKDSDFENALRAALKPVLVSPQFLFRLESDLPGDGKSVAVNADDYALATRLSYYLWASMPDEELFQLAAEKKLSDPKVLGAQVVRMLANPKAAALTDEFAVPWLQLNKLDKARPNRDFFPTLTNQLKGAMAREVTTFFDTLRTENRSVLEMIESDYTYANDVLAKHYGFAEVKGDAMQRIALKPGDHRGGLLGMAGIQTMTSHTSRTSPTQRGKYVLEVMLGAPPPPPPANVGTIEDAPPKGKEAQTFRDKLAQHATRASCAGCHAKIDPLGFAMDNFNAIGAWRESTKEVPLDVKGQLPGGEKIDGFADLKKVLWNRKDEFARALVEKMLIYALGRELDHYDESALRECLAALKADEYRFQTLIRSVVRSVPFRQRRAAAKE